MKAFNNLKIGMRLGLGFALLIVTALGIAIFARLSLNSVKVELDLLTQDRMVKVGQLESIKDNVNVIARAVRNIVILKDTGQMAKENERIGKARAENGELFKKLDETIRNERGQKLMATADALRGPYNASVEKVTALGMASQADQAREVLLGELRSNQNKYMESLQEGIEFQRELMQESTESVDQTVDRTGTLLMTIALVAGALGALIAWVITRSITAPIREAVQVAETVAGGDLRSKIEVSSRDETGQLLGALKRMNESLVRIVGAVRGNADSVSTASTQIAQGNADLSQRTEEQASNLQQTAASMEQLTATVKQNAETARTASQLATSASGVAAQGGTVVGEVVSTMEDISASSRKIADIIGVIDGIAFQTNILALNAAVEAARAGEQGRGFAVVASEVRSLAQRSANAAKEIKALIGESVEKVQTGSTLVGNAGQTMGEIVNQVKRVSDLISEISAASVEQTQGIGQIGDAVSQLDQVTQQNAALVEESAAAAESLKHQAAQLAQTVSVFKTTDSATAATPAPAGKTAAPVRPATARPAAAKSAAKVEPKAVAQAEGGEDWAAF
jgi:methyl-accepting chemotaxis protein